MKKLVSSASAVDLPYMCQTFWLEIWIPLKTFTSPSTDSWLKCILLTTSEIYDCAHPWKFPLRRYYYLASRCLCLKHTGLSKRNFSKPWTRLFKLLRFPFQTFTEVKSRSWQSHHHSQGIRRSTFSCFHLALWLTWHKSQSRSRLRPSFRAGLRQLRDDYR